MSLSGGISFFDRSLSLFKDGITAVASSNTAAQNLALGSNQYLRWESNGSDDTTQETLTLTFPNTVSVSRIFILGHNLKNFSITSNDGSFTNVNSLDGTGLTGISETAYNRETAYYEFDAVSLDDLILTMDTTQTADEEKHVTQIIVTNELGTLAGFPELTNVQISRNPTRDKTITGRSIIEKSYEARSFNLRLLNYPYQADVDILDSLHEREKSFLVWLCGGKPDNFRIKQRGWKLGDLMPMQIDNNLQNGYEKNVYSLGVTGRYSFEEVIP
jgi:hypothetical protein